MINKKELLALVRLLMEPPEGLSLDELSKLEDRFSDSVPHPGGIDLLNYPAQWGLPENMDPSEVVENALSWKPRALTLQVTDVRPHPSDDRLRCYEVTAEGIVRTQVVGNAGIGKGNTVIVAMSGCRLLDGTEVKHAFVGRAFSAGKLIGPTSLPPGNDVTSQYCYLGSSAPREKE